MHYRDNSTNIVVNKDDNRNVLRFVKKVRSHWHWFAFSVILCLSLGFLYIRYKSPIYSVSAKLLVNDAKSSSLGGNNELIDFNALFGSKSSVDNEAEILKTRYLLEKVVDDLQANVIYYRKGTVKDQELYNSPFLLQFLNQKDTISGTSFTLRYVNEEVFDIDVDDESKRCFFGKPLYLPKVGKVQILRNSAFSFDEHEYKCSVLSKDAMVKMLRSNIDISVTDKQASTIDINFLTVLPRKGENTLNSLIRKYAEEGINDKNRIADSTISFIENRLLYVGRELGDVEGNIQSFKQKNQLADIETQSELLLRSEETNQSELVQTETKLSILKSIEDYLIDNDGNKRVLPSAVIEGDLVFSSLVDKYNSLLLERDRQTLSSTNENPFVQNLDTQIRNLRADMLSNIRNTRNSLEIAKRRLLEREGRSVGQIRKVPAVERTYLDLARQQKIKQELYVFLLQKREETAISKTSNISNAKVIDPPKADPEPISPKKKKILSILFVLGMGIPVLVLYLKELFNTRIVDKDDISSLTKVPIIAEINENSDSNTIVVYKDSRSVIAEQFRALRTNLTFYLKGTEKTILLTSSMSGEGKSFIALNMAITLSLAGKKVIVMEMDLRKPNLSNKLGITNNFGFTNFIIDSTVSTDDIIRPSGLNDSLSVICSGPIPPNPAELLMDDRMSVLMNELKDRYDYIIVDAPPIGLVTDAQLLNYYADLVLYVVRHGVTFKGQLNIIEDLYESKKMNRLSLVVNGIDSSVNDYGYGYSYGYGYGHGGGYFEERNGKRRTWKLKRTNG